MATSQSIRSMAKNEERTKKKLKRNITEIGIHLIMKITWKTQAASERRKALSCGLASGQSGPSKPQETTLLPYSFFSDNILTSLYTTGSLRLNIWLLLRHLCPDGYYITHMQLLLIQFIPEWFQKLRKWKALHCIEGDNHSLWAIIILKEWDLHYEPAAIHDCVFFSFECLPS